MNPTQRHWASQQERGSEWLLSFSVWLTRHLPAWLLRGVIRVVVAYFFATSARQRGHVRRYQQRLKRARPATRLPAHQPIWQQFLAFGHAIVDRFAVWQGKIQYQDLKVEDPNGLYEDIQSSSQKGRRGQILVCSHLGNVEICRALVDHNQGFLLNILVHSHHAEKFNRALIRSGASDIRMIQVTDLDLPLMMALQQRIDAGEWIAIAGDRTPVRGDKTVAVNFLGHPAPFPQGPWLLAGLLKAPLNLVFCSRIDGQYRLRLERFSEPPVWSRQNREALIESLAQRFADRLAEECEKAPLQWFNFYDFWMDAEK
ncbi:MAG: glycosyl transferase family 2 [Lautropia sp.]|nr:glycosyl transferase family 2 [Lautropia sp.]